MSPAQVRSVYAVPRANLLDFYRKMDPDRPSPPSEMWEWLYRPSFGPPCSALVMESDEQLGYAAAISCDFRRNSTASALAETSRYRIGRFYLSGGWDLEAQCQMLRAFFSPLLAFRGAGLHARRWARRLRPTSPQVPSRGGSPSV